jgi:DNA-binding transcriptional LysR family regulator
MELRDLVYFLACLDEGHLTQAARRLHVAQPTLSHAIARLETETGEPLLKRPSKGCPGLCPTEVGRLLEQRARRVLAEVNAFQDDVAGLRGVLTGRLRIGSMQSLNSTIVPRPLAEFALSHPGVRVTLHTLAAEEIPLALMEGRLDVGLVAGAPASVLGELSVERLCTEELVAIVRSDEPLAERRRVRLGALRTHRFVLVLPRTFTHALILAACRQAGFEPDIVLALESGEAIREVVRAGLGITILPAGYLSPRDRGLRAVRLTHPTPKRDVSVVWAPEGRPSAAGQAFVKELRKWVLEP